MDKFFNRELSWLSFNHRVLQEGKDKSVPLYERIKFLAIFSSNLDEFFRVRVASLRSLLNLKKRSQRELDFDVPDLLNKIHKTVVKLQKEHSETYQNEIRPELLKYNINLINHKQLNQSQKEYLKDIFQSQIIPHIMPMIIIKRKIIPFLRNQRLYLAVRLSAKKKKRNGFQKKGRSVYALVEIPSNHLDRFILLPKEGSSNYIIFLDDVIRLFLPQIFNGYHIHESYAIKLTRDAELYIEDEFSGNLLEKIKKSLAKRLSGAPSRFLYDREMPSDFLNYLREALMLSKEDLYPAARYHNFSDFFNFPNPGYKELNYKEMKPIPLKGFEKREKIFESWGGEDRICYFPYHSYDCVLNMLEAAARDPDVKSIKITQYRVAKNSKVVSSLIKAANRGKKVTAFVEIKARFDEEINIKSAEEMGKAGVKVLYSLPGIKVHAKLALIERQENGGIKQYAYLSTGNFNESTARVYTDYGLFTSDRRITSEVEKVFDFLESRKKDFQFKHLLVAQFGMRQAFVDMIDNEISNARAGKYAEIIIKANSLEDDRMIKKLYEANRAGVRINLIIRSICCLVPGVKPFSENIRAISIVDRFLEHDRVYIFHNGGNEKIYMSSADWMRRNLSRRIEVAFPVYDENVKKFVRDIVNIKLRDNQKARIIDEKQINSFVKANGEPHRSQYEIYDYVKNFGTNAG
ncbi:MAG: polyphosphate kinase 1 [Ignavibacteria bacterium]|nr:polyphosphate kinase 1 [Ignavibacteria bacterium]